MDQIKISKIKTLNPKETENFHILNPEQFDNKHKNQRCFLFGNGPSLNKMEGLENLKNEIIFGVNKFHSKSPHFIPSKICSPTYLILADKVIFEEEWESISRINTYLFLGGEALKRFTKYHLDDVFNCHIIPIEAYYHKPVFRRCDGDPELIKCIYELKEKWWCFSCKTTIMDLALPVIYKMGFVEIYLLGIDMTPNGHFYEEISTEYYDSCMIKRLEDNFTIFNNFFKEEGRIIYNATKGGKLKAFERKSLEEVFKN